MTNGVASRDDTARLLDRLVQDIDDGDVVTIVGKELLVVQIPGRGEVLVYAYLAEQLAARLSIKFEPGDSLDTIACRYKDTNHEIDDVYGELRDVLVKIGPVAPPDALLKLAAIDGLRLFVSMTIDPLLENALDQMRVPRGAPKAQVLAYAPKQAPRQDLPCPIENLTGSVVFHLLGRPTANSPGTYAVTDADTLEFIHSLQQQTGPKLLFDALRTKSLLILGCGFPDWLARFAIRAAQQQQIYDRDKRTWVVDERLKSEQGLAFFLEHSPKVKVFDRSAISFVDQLHDRWKAAHPAQAAAPPPASDSPVAGSQRKTRPVFLSYASEDRAMVEKINGALAAANLDVWFDHDRLEPGADWYPMIKETINTCDLFIAILSQNTCRAGDRKFRFEWARAFEKADEFEFGRSFVIPLPIDETTRQNADPRFGRYTWDERLRAGVVTPEFVDGIVRLVRKNRS